MRDTPALPEGSRLIHVGPHKTGSTALQDALHQSRDAMREQGVVYVSRTKHDAMAARFATERLTSLQDPARAETRWRAVVSDLRKASSDRKVFSSEFLSDASDAQAERIALEVGREQTYVAITLRPLAKILPSQYQQYLARGSKFTYARWLEGMFNEPPYDRPTPTFWVRHRHDELVRRWGAVVGAENVVVVVLDSSDFSFGPHAFERILGLSHGLLAEKEVRTNRSLTWPEAEVLRRFNRQFASDARGPGASPAWLSRAVRELKVERPPDDEQRIETPGWAVERANEIGATMAEAIAASGAQVIGDLEKLSQATPNADETTPPVDVHASVAARFAVAVGMVALGVPASDDDSVGDDSE